MTKTLNQIIFFSLHQNQNIFFSNIGNQSEYFFRKKNMFLFQKEGVRYYRLKIRNFPIKVPRGTKDGIDMGKRKCY